MFKLVISGVRGAAYALALRGWRVLPLPRWLRNAVLWRGIDHYLVVVAALIWDEDGRLLLGRHSYLPPPGWNLPGGALHGLEAPETGLARELAEELGFAVEIGPLVASATLPGPRRVILAFECTRGPGDFQPNAEIVEVAYFSVAEAVQLIRRDARVVVEFAALRRQG